MLTPKLVRSGVMELAWIRYIRPKLVTKELG